MSDETSFGGDEFFQVSNGESLLTVSVKTGVPLSRLKTLNRSILIGSERVHDGMILRIKSPGLHTSKSPSPAKETFSTESSSNPLQSLDQETSSGTQSSVFTSKNRFSFTALSDALAQSFTSTPASASSSTSASASASSSTSISISTEPNLAGALNMASNGNAAPPTSTRKIPQPPSIPVPVLTGKSSLLTVPQAVQLQQHLPPMLQIDNWTLLYNLRSDGADFNTFFRKVRGVEFTVLIAHTVKNEMFGGFADAEWKPSKDTYYGSGESFIFKIKDDLVTIYPWTQLNSFFMYSAIDKIAMGGGEGDGFGWVLDADFLTGSSNHCKTYNNPVLTEEPGVIRISSVEVWGFSMHLRKAGNRSPR